MTGSPRFGRGLPALRSLSGERRVPGKHTLHPCILNSLADALAECLVDGFFDDKDDFLKTCLFLHHKWKSR